MKKRKKQTRSNELSKFIKLIRTQCTRDRQKKKNFKQKYEKNETELTSCTKKEEKKKKKKNGNNTTENKNYFRIKRKLLESRNNIFVDQYDTLNNVFKKMKGDKIFFF